MDGGASSARDGAEKDGATSTRAARRAQLREANLAAWTTANAGDFATDSRSTTKLDTSLKRHTALLTKLRSSLQLAAAVPLMIKEVQGLALEKYIEEAVGATVEGLGKCKTGAEVNGAVEIISALHTRFPILFTTPFQAALLALLKPSASIAADRDLKEKEDTARIIRQRGLLRVLGELELVGVVNGIKAGSGGTTGQVTWSILKDLLSADKETLPLTAPLAIAFLRHLAPSFLPPVSTTSSDAAKDAEFPTVPEATLPEEEDAKDPVPFETKAKFRKLLVAFLDALGRFAIKGHVDLQKTDKRNHEAYIRSGEVFEDREKGYEKSVKAWERAWASVTQLSELLSLAPPTLPTLSSTLGSTSILGNNSSSAFGTRGEGDDIGGPGSLWLDEEDRKFYEELRELGREVPLGILGPDQRKGKESLPSVEVKEAAAAVEEEEVKDEEMEVSAETVDKEEADFPPEDLTATSALSTGPGAQLTALLARLQDASSLSAIDTIAFEFAFLNSKAARKRLAKFLYSVNRNRQDVLPYYARLVATLDPFMPDLTRELIALLEDEFRYLQRKKQTDMAETRSKNLRFLSELTKFSLLPLHSILHIFKVLLDDFSGPNLDNLITVLEGCGRFLLRSETFGAGERMGIVLETLKRKMGSKGGLEEGMRMRLENAYYQCDPPDRPIVVPKERTPMQLYIRQLIYHSLTRNSSDRVLKLIRKLDWSDQLVNRKLFSAFTKVWKIKYSNVHLFAVLLYDLGRYHPDFNISVIDEVLENIRVGMEVNSFKFNQQRVATIKYLGELYNYRVVDSRVIFDTLWSLVTFGHPEGRPWPDVPSPIDAPDDCFRVRLVCTLLDTCGSCFERGALKKKLDSFLTFFQMYILSKSTMPMDVEFMVNDTFEALRPHLVLFKDFRDACEAVDDMMAAVAKAGPVDEIEEEGEGGRDEPRGGDAHQEGEAAGSSSDSDEESDSESDALSTSSHEDAASRRPNPSAITQEEEDDFSRELAKMMTSTTAESGVAGGQRKGPDRGKGGLMDVAVPFVRKRETSKNGAGETLLDDGANEGASNEGGGGGGGMKFTLLTKKGAKQQTFSMEIPRESAIAMHTLEKQAQNKKEQQELKRRVLDYEQREESAEKEALKATLAKRGVNLRFIPPKTT